MPTFRVEYLESSRRVMEVEALSMAEVKRRWKADELWDEKDLSDEVDSGPDTLLTITKKEG